MIPLQKIEDLAQTVRELEAELEEVKAKRNAAIVEAREEGETWQVIANHAEMTVQGVRNAADKHKESL